MKKYFVLMFMCIIFVSGFFMTSVSVFAESPSNNTVQSKAVTQLNAGSAVAGYGTEARDIRMVISSMIMTVVGVLGVIVTYLFILAGYHFVSSHGNEEKISKARKIMQSAIIGLIIILLSYSISYFLGTAAQDVVGLNPSDVPQQYDSPN